MFKCVISVSKKQFQFSMPIVKKTTRQEISQRIEKGNNDKSIEDFVLIICVHKFVFPRWYPVTKRLDEGCIIVKHLQ